MNNIDVQHIFPITRVSASKILSGIGDITWGYKIHFPDVFTLSETDYQSLYNQFLSAFSILPEGTVVSQQDCYYVDEYKDPKALQSFTLKENHKNLLGRSLLRHTSYLYISYPDKKIHALTENANSAVKLTNYLRNPFKGFPKTYEKAERLRKELGSVLSSIDGIEIHHLSTEDLVNNIYRHWTFENDYTKGKRLAPILKDDGKLKVGDQYVGVISMINHGEVVQHCKSHKGSTETEDSDLKVEKGISLKLGNTYQAGFGLPFNHTLTRTFIIRNKERTNLKLFFASSKESFMSVVGMTDATKRIQDISGFKDAISNRGYTVVDMSLNVIIPCHTLSELEEKTTIANTTLRNINDCQSYVEPFQEALPIWVGTTPGYTRGNYRSFITAMEHALTYFTFESTTRGSYEGHLFTDRFGNPMVIDLWNSPHIANRNAIIEGGSGTGKSFTVNNIIDQDLEQGYHVIILDVGHSYKDQCIFHSGRYFNSSDLSSLSFAIFICTKDSEGLYCPDPDKLLFIQSILLSIWKGGKSANNEEYAIIMDIIDSFYKYINQSSKFPDLTEFYAFVKEEYEIQEQRKSIFNKEAFIITLEPFVLGKYKTLLNSRETIELTTERFIVFDIEAVAEDIYAFPVVGLIIMEMVMEKVRKLRGQKKRFIIDEGWKVLKGQLSGFVEYLYRTFRKNEGSVCLATQAITDLYQNVGKEMARSLIANADTMILMRRGTVKNYDDLKAWLSLTDFEITMMKDAKRRDEQGYREFFLKQGDKSMLVRLESAKKTIATYSSKGEEKARISKHFQDTGNLEYAINQYTEENIKLHFLQQLHEEGLISMDQLKNQQTKITQL